MVTRRLQAERRTGSVRRPETGVLPTVLRNQPDVVNSNLAITLLRLCQSGFVSHDTQLVVSDSEIAADVHSLV